MLSFGSLYCRSFKVTISSQDRNNNDGCSNSESHVPHGHITNNENISFGWLEILAAVLCIAGPLKSQFHHKTGIKLCEVRFAYHGLPGLDKDFAEENRFAALPNVQTVIANRDSGSQRKRPNRHCNKIRLRVCTKLLSDGIIVVRPHQPARQRKSSSTTSGLCSTDCWRRNPRDQPRDSSRHIRH